MNTELPTIKAVKALDGRIFAMLTDDEQAVLAFYRARGRKFGVSVSIVNKADPVALANATSAQHADQILRSANSLISVTVEDRAEELWAERSGVDNPASH